MEEGCIRLGSDVIQIRISDAKLSKGGSRIENTLHIPRELKKYFKDNKFYAEYDRNLSEVPLSILNIPALSSILHFAWAVGCDIELGELDETHLKGLEKAKKIFSDNPAYNFLSFNSSLNVSKSTENTFEKQNKQSLLFSGGLDSMASYIHRKPERLIMIWGLDVPTSWTGFWERIVKTYEHLSLTFIKSNTMDIYDLSMLYSLGKTNTAGYYPGFAYSLVTFGLCPPATVGDVDNVMMASTYPTDRQYGDPDYPFQSYKPFHLVDRHLGWANIETLDVETEYNRPEKIENFIKPHFDVNRTSVIRVCGHRGFLKARRDHTKLNCGICDKCGRAIAHLSNYGISPVACGFEVNEKTFGRIKKTIVSKRYNPEKEKYFWGELKKHISEDTSKVFPASRSFLEWLRGYKL